MEATNHLERGLRGKRTDEQKGQKEITKGFQKRARGEPDHAARFTRKRDSHNKFGQKKEAEEEEGEPLWRTEHNRVLWQAQQEKLLESPLETAVFKTATDQ
ncbi:hypothetical protein SLE2022_383310 [Rubroshorea leprosula]